ncbi:hypothetical protein TRVL_04794 [Trypanosoma vivax]|nr:hypothetical protein TRVL_04794 [Trypanosoma vivax]
MFSCIHAAFQCSFQCFLNIHGTFILRPSSHSALTCGHNDQTLVRLTLHLSRCKRTIAQFEKFPFVFLYFPTYFLMCAVLERFSRMHNTQQHDDSFSVSCLRAWVCPRARNATFFTLNGVARLNSSITLLIVFTSP